MIQLIAILVLLWMVVEWLTAWGRAGLLEDGRRRQEAERIAQGRPDYNRIGERAGNPPKPR